ncbi:MAG: hypothetical protein II264_03420 [Ruminococcus sp.]|nr:hypothetical protein [Ruminococcus sp.]
MTANEFLIEEINRRAEAAKVLSEDIKLNDVEISSGCYSDGIRLWCGIEQVAALTNTIISEHTETMNTGHKKLIRSVEINGTVFYQEIYCKDGDAE